MKFTTVYTNPKKFKTDVFSETPNGSPSALTAVPSTSTSILLSWTNGSTNESHISIERSTDGITFTYLAYVVKGVSTYTDSTVTTTQEHYYYRVRAFKQGNYSSYSNIASNSVPLSLLTINTQLWLDATDLSTLTIDGSNHVSQWNDKSANANIMAFFGTPHWSVNGVLFDGVDDGGITFNPLVVNQPLIVYIAMRQKGWQANRFIFSDRQAGGAPFVSQYTATPGMSGNAGNYGYPNYDAAIDELVLVRALFNGATGKLQVNNNYYEPWDYGALGLSGFSLGAYNNGSDNSNIEVLEVILRDCIDSLATDTAIANYLALKHNIQGVIYEAFPTGDYVSLTVTQPIVPEIARVYYTATAGKDIYIDWGDGSIFKMICDGTARSIARNYGVAGTFNVRIGGELDGLIALQIGGQIWGVDITEFGKCVNLSTIYLVPNVQTLIGDIGVLHSLVTFWASLPLTPGVGIHGSLDNCPNLETFECQGTAGNYFVTDVTGDYANLTHLKDWCAITKCTGDITALDLHYLSWGYGIGDATTGYIQAADTPVRLTGDISNMVNLWYFAVNAGASTITGDCALLAAMEWFPTPRITKPASLASMPKLSYFVADYGWVLSAAEVNQYLADLWANREVVRDHYINTVAGGAWTMARNINLATNVGSAAPSGQGIIDKANLQATVSPAVPGDGIPWAIITN